MKSVEQRNGKDAAYINCEDVTAVTTPLIAAYLQSHAGQYSPQTLNRIRPLLGRIFGAATIEGLCQLETPASTVTRCRGAERLQNHLRWHEVKPVLEAISPGWRPLFAGAIYTAMRKRELLGLCKSDIDWGSGLIFVGSSRDRSEADAIPIADELVPYLQIAVERSSSELVFPGGDGSMWRKTVDFGRILRGALSRVGIVDGYTHCCDQESCGFSERHADAALRQCPTCNEALRPAAHEREMRFHDLRHTTAILLKTAGANPAAIQRILRHDGPRIATEGYSNLSPDYLRSEINRLRFEPASAAGPRSPVQAL